MPYKVVRAFTDNQDNKRVYEVGDVYPKGDKKPTEERVKRLLDGTNDNKKVYLEEEPETLDDLTVKDLKAKLDEKELEYDPKAKKADLIKLLEK